MFESTHHGLFDPVVDAALAGPGGAAREGLAQARGAGAGTNMGYGVWGMQHCRTQDFIHISTNTNTARMFWILDSIPYT